MINGRINLDLKSLTFYGVIIICWLENPVQIWKREKSLFLFIYK